MSNEIETAEVMDTGEDFAALLEESLGAMERFEGRVVAGKVIAVDKDTVVVDVGLKSEGRIPMKEFGPDGEMEIKTGDTVDVFVERMENVHGEAVLSRDRARREEAWEVLEGAFNDSQRVTGRIFGKVKGGFTVDLNGAVAFLPGSQVDIRPVRDVTPLMNSPQPFQILKMDRQRGNIVVSRRAVLEETREEARAELVKNLKEGQVLQGVVKNITDYGAFVDLGGIDGLLHVTDISWKRVNHPTEVLQIGQTVDVQVIRFNPETQRISLGMKQLEADPWEGVDAKYPIGVRVTGRVTNITDYGAFVELEAGIEGLVHVSEMSWTKKNIHPGKIVSTSQEVEVMVLDVDSQRRRISLGLKQTMDNPWEAFAAQYPSSTELEGEIKNITEFGLFVGLLGEIDGMVHLSDLSWDKSGETAVADFAKGDMVKFKILEVDVEKERISLGIKQLESDPFESAGDLKRGVIVTCTITAVTDGGLEVTVSDGVPGFIRKAELARERQDQRPDRFAVGEKVDAKITNIDKNSRKLSLSIKGREVEENKKAMEQYGSSDSGASLGDILGAALNQAQSDDDAESGAESDTEVGAVDAPEETAEAASEESAAEPAEEPAEEPAAEAAEAASEEPAADAAEEPAEEPAAEAAEAASEEPAAEPAEEPAEEPAAEAAEDVAEEPSEEPAAEAAEVLAEDSAEEPAGEADEAAAEAAETVAEEAADAKKPAAKKAGKETAKKKKPAKKK